MPYSSNAELPDPVKAALPAAAQSIYRNAWNSAEKQHGAEDESRLARIAWGAVKNAGWVKQDDGKWTHVEKAAFSMRISKIDTPQRKVFGFASVAKLADGSDLVDRQGDILDSPSMQRSVYTYVLDSRDGGEMHTRRGVAKLCESVYFTTEKLEAMGLKGDAIPESWWVGFQVDDDDVWQGVTSGQYAAFSIAGLGSREDYGEGT